MTVAATLRTAVVIESLPRGRWLAWPFADPELTQLGRAEDDPRLIMSLALPEHLKTLRGAELARYATPPGTFMRTTPVAIARADMAGRGPHAARLSEARHGPGFTIAVPWIATPYGKELWLHLPPLKLTLRVDEASEIDALVQSEVRRVLAATEPSPDALLQLFPALAYRLEWIDVALERAARDGAHGKSATAKAIAAEEAHALLLTVASPVHADARVIEGAPLVGRPSELDALDRLLAKHSVLVHGPELSGKTALIEGWLRARLASPDPGFPRDPRALPPVLVYATSGARLMAGMSLLGQWQERLRRVLQAVATLNGVLWIEHLAELVGEAGHGEELANALRPWLEDGRVRLVTELRDDEVDRLERRYPALLATLARVRLTALDVPATLQVLAARRLHARHREPDRPSFEAAALPELVALAGRYQSQLALPGSAVRLGEDVRSLADAEPRREGDARGTAARPVTPATIDHAQLQRLYAALTGLPQWLLDDRRPLDVAATRAQLAAQVIGQDAAVRAVAESLAVIKTRLAARGKPLASFLFAGPTGVGKTELARALAVLLFGSEARLARFDMSEFMDAAAAERLIRGSGGSGGDGGASGIGAPRDGLLTRRLRREPLSVVLLDEIEKAHQSVFDLLLQALGEGRLTDASGRTASLEGAIVILTSNLGASGGSGGKPRRIGLVDSDADALSAHYLAAVKKHFAPEMVNRLERIIPFAPLGAEPLRRIVRIQVDRVRQRRGLAAIALDVSDAALDHVAAAGTTAEYGARALRRAVDRLLVTPLAHAIAREPAGRVASVSVDVAAGAVDAAGGALTFALTERTKTATVDPLMKVGRMRREARHFLASTSVREVRDLLEHIDADLMRGAPAGPLLNERARLDALLAPFQAISDDLEQLEDLLYMGDGKGRVTTLTPELEGELAWAESRLADLGTAAFEVLTAIEQRRDHALLALTELDDERAFDRWLAPLLEEAERRRWIVRAWIERESAPDWPRDLALGPPRSAAELYIRIEERPSDFRHLILGVSGRHAGTLLACEAGVIGLRPSGAAHAHLYLQVLSTLRAGLTPENIRDSRQLGPPPIESRGPLAHGNPARLFLTAPERMLLFAAGQQQQESGDVARYFAGWERHAARHLRVFDEHVERDRSDLFESPFDEEMIIHKMIAEAAERADLYDRVRS